MNASSTFPMGLSCLNCQFKHDFNYKLQLHVTATNTVHIHHGCTYDQPEARPAVHRCTCMSCNSKNTVTSTAKSNNILMILWLLPAKRSAEYTISAVVVFGKTSQRKQKKGRKCKRNGRKEKDKGKKN
jgi:hypothetical protein